MTTDPAPDQRAENAEAPAVAVAEAREALPQTTHSDRLLWIGAGVALVAHALPFMTWSRNPDPLGEGVLTEAIAVELVDKAALEGRDQTPPAPPAAAAPQTAPQQPSQAQRPQRAQQAVPPAPPASSPAKRAEPAPDPAKPEPASPALPAFKGDGDSSQPKTPAPSKSPQSPQEPQKEDAPEKEKQAKRQRPTPPPQPAAKAQPAAPPVQSSAKPSQPRTPSSPALARSGEVTQFAKDVVAALAKAKPIAPRDKENKPIKGKVQVTVVVAPEGGIRFAKVTGESGNADLDKIALEAAKKAAVPTPPPDIRTDDLFYDVEYNFQ